MILSYIIQKKNLQIKLSFAFAILTLDLSTQLRQLFLFHSFIIYMKHYGHWCRKTCSKNRETYKNVYEYSISYNDSDSGNKLQKTFKLKTFRNTLGQLRTSPLWCFYLTFLHIILIVSSRQDFQPYRMYTYWTIYNKNSYDCRKMNLTESKQFSRSPAFWTRPKGYLNRTGASCSTEYAKLTQSPEVQR